ncbi:F-box domain-containing protein [Favolaschia claudopus]|uniref:F-box domain-containing protein n=1 Tax=Favolaschia claudopus TaxID=2862362 RepID=A0AAW0EL40_9AGAR
MASISPIQSLPVELLREIFEYRVEKKEVFAVSQVCSRWRQIAHNSPRLWTDTVRVDVERLLDSVYLDGLKIWLARSEPLLISLSCVAGSHNRYGVLEQIFHTSFRWRSLQFQQSALSLLPISVIAKLAETPLSALEDLDLGGIEEGPPPVTITSSALPRLRRVTISHYTFILHIQLPWAQLTHLTFSTYRGDVAINVLAQCTSLVEAAVYFNTWDELAQPAQPIQTLSELRSLTLGPDGEEGYISPFFDRVSAPALEKLDMDFVEMDGNIEWSETSFTAFQMRSSRITYLELNGCFHLSPENLCTALRHLPCIAELKLGYCYDIVGNEFMTMLVNKDGVTPLAPRLHNLVLMMVDRNVFAPNHFVDMLSSRWWTEADVSVPRAVARWTHVELEMRGDVSLEFTEIIQGLQDRGLPLKFYAIPSSFLPAETL